MADVRKALKILPDILAIAAAGAFGGALTGRIIHDIKYTKLPPQEIREFVKECQTARDEVWKLIERETPKGNLMINGQNATNFSGLTVSSSGEYGELGAFNPKNDIEITARNTLGKRQAQSLSNQTTRIMKFLAENPIILMQSTRLMGKLDRIGSQYIRLRPALRKYQTEEMKRQALAQKTFKRYVAGGAAVGAGAALGTAGIIAAAKKRRQRQNRPRGR